MLRKLRFMMQMTGLAFGLCFLAVASLKAVEVRKERASRAPLPSRIGEVRVEPTFWEDVAEQGSEMWIGIYATLAPGLLPAHVDYDRKDPTSLDALRARTKYNAHGLGPVSAPQLNF